ncbi:RHS repeat domain-containing protein [Pseudomonas sichuanensis]|uniref:YD repeat-containing protein n=1 Tax=Pseudomonas sichuanensis TaxID=2213015 RepID=A0ABV0DBQ9_9PSED
MSTLHTQAGNFLDFLKTGVDHRTGQFTLAIALPLPPANQLCGPALTLTLSFNLLSSALDRGYGQGWALGLSEIDLDQNAANLRLSSGEQFAVDLSASPFTANGRLVLHDQKLTTFLVTWQADGSLRVDHKSGECETLRRQDSDSSRYLLAELRSPEGRRLFFDWLPFAESDYRLQQIRDEQRTLLSLEDRQGDLHFILNPHSQQPATLRALLSNDWLTEVHLPGVEQPFIIDYEPIDLPGATTLLLPSYTRSPLGAEDIVHWASDSDGHHLPPGAPFPYLPRVAAWTHSCGTPASELNHRYQWVGSSNFLGFGSDQAFTWTEGRDNLYQVQSDYHYQVIETLTDAYGRTLDTLTRTWNRFHLLTLEASRRGDCETQTRTIYGIAPQLTWEQQPSECQLPHEVTTTYIDHARQGANRSETTTYRYDDFGNVTHVRYPNGIQEFTEHYPAKGAEGCPPDALGMVRFIRQKRVIPAPADGNAPILGTRYTYQRLPSLIEDAPAHIVVASEEGFFDADGQAYERTEQVYITESGPHYGRERQSITTLNGKATTTRHSYMLDDTELVSQSTVIGFENDEENRTSDSRAQSLLSGQTCWERDRAGACTRYHYDPIGRIVRTVTAADSPYETVRTTRFHLDDAKAREARAVAQDNPVMIEQTDSTGCRQRQWLDGDGRVVRLEREDFDHAPGTFREVSHHVYDALGRQISQTAKDWQGQGSQPLFELTSTTTYDDWGQPALSVSPDGLRSHFINDPVTLRSEQWQTAGEQTGAKLLVLNDASGNPIEQRHLAANGEWVRTLKLVRDGLGRVVEERVEALGTAAIVTRTGYDHYGRVIEQTLPDGTRLSWTFAAHSDDQHVESISVTPAQEDQP